MLTTLFNRGTGAFAAALTLIGMAHPASAQSNEQIADTHLRELERVDGWACDYVYGSARSVRIVSSDEARIVISSRYDYRCGDDTFSDTVYIAFSNGVRTCSAYRSFGKTCGLDGYRYDL